MPLLTPWDPLPDRPRRILVAGTSGAGKSTLAGTIAGTIGVPYIEIDALFHGPGWTPRTSFEHDVDAFSSGPAWVTEWQYTPVRALLAERADLVVWLDLRRPTVMRQVVVRTVRRRARRETLWNGNTEPPLRTVLTDPEHIVRWAWKTHAQTPERIRGVLSGRPDLAVVRVRSHPQARAWTDGPLRASAAEAP